MMNHRGVMLASALLLGGLIVGAGLRASGQSAGGQRADWYQYRVMLPAELEFASPELVEEFLNRMGQAGWEAPETAEIIAYVSDPGTAAQRTIFLLRADGPYDEACQTVIFRRRMLP